MERYTPTALVVFAFMGVFYLEGFDMGKDPAVLFYTSDFISGTITMTDEQRGKYILLLCIQHQKGHLTEKDMLNICKTYDEDIWCKFKNEDGVFFNERMKEESEKRAKYAESRRDNRKKKEVKEEDIKNISSTYVPHMENENENESKDVIKDNLLKREDIFKKEILTYINTYPKEMLKNFFDYWSEPNKSKSKMRFEMQNTWDLKRRLATWAKNDKGFKPAVQKGVTEADAKQIMRNIKNRLENEYNRDQAIIEEQ